MEVAHGATRSLDAGNALKWSGATPLFATCSWRKKRGGRSSPHVLREARLGARGEWVCCYQSRRATSFSRGTDSSPARFATNAETYSARFASRGTANRKCIALANVEVMLKGLRATGGDGRASTRLTANEEPQRLDNSRFIGRILTWKKLSVFNQKQRTCRRKKCLSRTWVLRDLENRSF